MSMPNQSTTIAPNRNLYRLNLTKQNPEKFYIPSDPLAEIDDQLTFETNFDYFQTHDFHKLLKKVKNSSKKSEFSIFHSNIQSLQNKLDKIHILLADLGHTFDIIALSETWTDTSEKKSSAIGQLEGYGKFVFTPGSSLKGGCGFFIKNGLKYLERKELDIAVADDINEFQAKWVEIIQTNGKNIMVGVGYRHPRRKSYNSFCTYLKK